MFTPGKHTLETIDSRLSAWDDPERCRLLIKSFPGLFLLTDTNCDIVMSNQPIDDPPLSTAIGHRLESIVSPAHRDAIVDASQAALERGEICQLDVQIGTSAHAPWYRTVLFAVSENGVVGGVAVAGVDITSLKTAEEQRRASENRYRMLAECSSDVIVRCGVESTIHYASPVCASVMGYSQAEMAGRGLLDFVHSEDLAIAQEVFNGLHDGDKACRSEFRLRHRDGHSVFIELTGRRIQPGGSRPPEYICSLRDISRRLATVLAHRQSEERYRSMIQSSPMGMHLYEVDDQDRLILIDANPAADSILGICHRELVGRTLEEAFPPLKDTEIPDRYRRAALHGERFDSDRVEYAESQVRGVFDVHAFQSGPRRVTVLFLDVTDRYLAGEAIRESECKFREIAELLPIGVYECDASGQLVYVNKRLMDYFGVTAEDLNVGMGILDIFSAEDRSRAGTNLRRLLAGGRIGRNEYLVQRKDGTKFPARFHSTPIIRNDTVCGVRGVLQDITLDKQREQESLRAQKLESVGLLAGGIAHDFNNLLTGILGNVVLAAQDFPDHDERAKLLKCAEQAIERARTLTSQLLTFSAGGEPIRRQTDVRSLLNNAISHAARGTGIHVEVGALPETIPRIAVDPVQIGQVIHNLVRNARDAMPDGGSVKVSVGTETNASGTPVVTIAIRDSGPGIDSEVLPHIFDPYFTTRDGQLGLGLAAAYSIVKKHDGSISVTSDPGAGTVFTIELPAESPVSPGVRATPSRTADQIARRVLVMDDEDIIRDLARRILSRHGWQVVCVSDGQAAINRFIEARDGQEPFDVVVLDLTVPGGMGGKDTIVRLRELDPGVRAIVCSGYSNDPVLASYDRHGFVGIVAKPYRPDELVRAVHNALELGPETPATRKVD
ncbi:MAG: PAS domain S-box protein [candidate division Zixibacteria bacterium]|jgi:PAS domain S-box-containing protein|nr:PAS domain S-box protein [candidate division Zixibacteria bacterium]